MTKKEKKLITLSFGLGILIVMVAFVFNLGVSSVSDDASQTQKEETAPATTTIPKVGEPGSEHSHMMFILSILGDTYSFDEDRYYEQDEHVHMHSPNDLAIHKHAVGVTLPYFLETVDIELTDRCLLLDTGETYCEDSTNKLTLLVNGDVIESPETYELKHGDRILLNYGSEKLVNLRVQAQSIPELPENLRGDYEPPE